MNRFALATAFVGVVVCLGSTRARADFTMPVHFQFRSDEITFQGQINTAYLMLDVDGGRNKVNNARQMSCAGTNPKICQLDVTIAEGDYIYTFVANPEEHVDLSDPTLNPDDIPHANFFSDPHVASGCGQFGKDNCLSVRNPNRPVFDVTSFTPGHGALVTSSS